MPNGETCGHHTAMAVEVGQCKQRLDDTEGRVRDLEKAVGDIRATMLRGVGALSVLVFLLSIFGARIAEAIFR